MSEGKRCGIGLWAVVIIILCLVSCDNSDKVKELRDRIKALESKAK